MIATTRATTWSYITCQKYYHESRRRVAILPFCHFHPWIPTFACTTIVRCHGATYGFHWDRPRAVQAPTARMNCKRKATGAVCKRNWPFCASLCCPCLMLVDTEPSILCALAAWSTSISRSALIFKNFLWLRPRRPKPLPYAQVRWPMSPKSDVSSHADERNRWNTTVTRSKPLSVQFIHATFWILSCVLCCQNKARSKCRKGRGLDWFLGVCQHFHPNNFVCVEPTFSPEEGRLLHHWHKKFSGFWPPSMPQKVTRMKIGVARSPRYISRSSKPVSPDVLSDANFQIVCLHVTKKGNNPTWFHTVSTLFHTVLPSWCP